jgi:hypothetical protein
MFKVGAKSEFMYRARCDTLITTVFSGLLNSYFDIYSNAGNSAETLTGRLGIWASSAKQ